jgi:hypothetical protein
MIFLYHVGVRVMEILWLCGNILLYSKFFFVYVILSLFLYSWLVDKQVEINKRNVSFVNIGEQVPTVKSYRYKNADGSFPGESLYCLSCVCSRLNCSFHIDVHINY